MMSISFPQLPSKYWRIALIGAFTLFVASAVLTPEFNPLTRGRMLAAENTMRVWAEVAQWRSALTQAHIEQERWPDDISRYAPPITKVFTRVTSPRPYVLQFDIDKQASMGVLAGTQVIFEVNPVNNAWTCRAGTPPMPTSYLPENCAGAAKETSFTILGMLSLICALIFVIAALLLLLRHPLLGPVQLKPERLRRAPYRTLSKLDRLLGMVGRRQSTLNAADISVSDWLRAVRYADSKSDKRVESLAARLGARSTPSTEWSLPGQVYEWRFSVNLPISLDRCLVFVPSAGLDDSALVESLIGAQTGADVMLVLAEHAPETPLPLLDEYCHDHANMFVLIDSASQTECLLTKKPDLVLMRMLSAQLRVTRISPYQTRGAITNAAAFFGRDQLLARVVSREPSNYLVVGGRQLGKSSLLKAVQRQLQGHPHIVCHYLSLRDHRLAPRMAMQLGLDASTSIEEIIRHIETNFSGKQLFLLIDEADLFFRDESLKGYPQLAALRSLSDEGRCWFMLAGFWDLYATAVLDYQSPLRNFGEVLTIGGLEAEACKDLATIPLSRLRFGFASNRLVDQLVEASGQRANLLAILCQECLEVLQPGERAIDSRHIAMALSSQAVQDALAGWGRLSHDDDACRLDRIVVYHTALHGKTSLSALAGLLETRGHQAQPEALRHALSRLQLAYVLRRVESDYLFAIPLFSKQFEQSELALLLNQELSLIDYPS